MSAHSTGFQTPAQTRVRPWAGVAAFVLGALALLSAFASDWRSYLNKAAPLSVTEVIERRSLAIWSDAREQLAKQAGHWRDQLQGITPAAPHAESSAPLAKPDWDARLQGVSVFLGVFALIFAQLSHVRGESVRYERSALLLAVAALAYQMAIKALFALSLMLLFSWLWRAPASTSGADERRGATL